MRGRNDAIVDNPFDQGMESIALACSDLLKRIVETVYRRGLKTRFLRKHLTDVDTFFAFLDASQFYRGIDFFDFLRSEERDVDTFAKRRRRTRVHRTIPT